MSRLQRTLIEEVRAYAKAQGFDLVFADGVIYSTPSLDITPAILTALQARPARPGAAPPAPASGSTAGAESQAAESLSGAGRRLRVRRTLCPFRSGSLRSASAASCAAIRTPASMASPRSARPTSRAVSFLANPRYRAQLAHTRAAAVVLEASVA